MKKILNIITKHRFSYFDGFTLCMVCLCIFTFNSLLAGIVVSITGGMISAILEKWNKNISRR